MPRVFTVEEAAEVLRATPEAVREELESGKLSGFQVGGEWRVTSFGLAIFMGAPALWRRRHRFWRRHRHSGQQNLGFAWQPATAFSYHWPRRAGEPEAVEEYAEAFESAWQKGRFRRGTLVVGFTNRSAAGIEDRRRAVVFLVRNDRRGNRVYYPLVEFAGANDYDTTRRMASVIKLPDRTHLKPGDSIPSEYQDAEVAVYSDVVTGPYASSGMAVVVQDTDLDAMARHALVRLRWSFRRGGRHS